MITTRLSSALRCRSRRLLVAAAVSMAGMAGASPAHAEPGATCSGQLTLFADLVITEVQASRAGGWGYIRVKNQGVGCASGARLRVTHPWGTSDQWVEELRPGQTALVIHTESMCGGPRTLLVDHENVVLETNEINNTAEYSGFCL